MSEDIEVLKHKAVHKGELCFEGLYIDKRKRIVVRKKNEIDLTYTEFEILLLLAQNAGIVFSKEQIYDRVWKEPYYRRLQHCYEPYSQYTGKDRG